MFNFKVKHKYLQQYYFYIYNCIAQKIEMYKLFTTRFHKIYNKRC